MVLEPRNGETRESTVFFCRYNDNFYTPWRATRLSASATNTHRREYFLRVAITIERCACNLFSMFFLLDLPRHRDKSSFRNDRARDRVARENECQEAAFSSEISEIRKSYDSYTYINGSRS